MERTKCLGSAGGSALPRLAVNRIVLLGFHGSKLSSRDVFFCIIGILKQNRVSESIMLRSDVSCFMVSKDLLTILRYECPDTDFHCQMYCG